MTFPKLSFFTNHLQGIKAKFSLEIRKTYYQGYLKNLGSGYINYNLQRHSGPHKQICYAAERSMYFDINGEVIACCMNRSYFLGKFPEKTIREIWEGEKRKELRSALKINDFSKGCFQCKDSIENGSFAPVQAFIYDYIPTDKKYPTMLEFALSSKCNLNCIMCSDVFSTTFLSEKGSSLEKEVYDDRFVNQLEEFIPHLDWVRFFGGEPFLIPLYYKIWERIVEINPGCQINLQTNGTILNDRIKGLLKKGNFVIGVSIDSFNKSTYESIRRNANFDKVMQNVEYFADYAKLNNKNLGVSVCPMKQNWEELPEIVLKCNELNSYIFFNTVWFPAKCSLFFLTSAELQVIHTKLKETVLPNTTDVEKKNRHHYESFLRQLKKWQFEKAREESIWKDHGIDKKNWQTSSIEELIDILIERLRSYFLNDNNIAGFTYSNQLNDLISIIKLLENNILQKETLLRLIEIPPDFIAYELIYTDHRSLERFINNFIGLVKKNHI